MITYVEGRKRIEIDSVLAQVGDKRFWDYIKEELESIFPDRDYNRSITVSEYVFPEVFELFQEREIEIVKKKQAPIRDKWIERLGNNTEKGLLDVKLYKKLIDEELRDYADDDEVEKMTVEEFKKLFVD